MLNPGDSDFGRGEHPDSARVMMIGAWVAWPVVMAFGTMWIFSPVQEFKN